MKALNERLVTPPKKFCNRTSGWLSFGDLTGSQFRTQFVSCDSQSHGKNKKQKEDMDTDVDIYTMMK